MQDIFAQVILSRYLSGDQLDRMDCRTILAQHVAQGANITVATTIMSTISRNAKRAISSPMRKSTPFCSRSRISKA